MKPTWVVGCYWLQAKEHWTNSGLKNKVFIYSHSQKSEHKRFRVGQFTGSVTISRTQSNLLSHHFQHIGLYPQACPLLVAAWLPLLQASHSHVTISKEKQEGEFLLVS